MVDGLGRAGSAWVHLPGEDPDSQDWTFRERVQKGWEKRRKESAHCRREWSQLPLRTNHAARDAVRYPETAVACLPETGQPFHYQRGGAWPSAPDLQFISSPKTALIESSLAPARKDTVGQSYPTRITTFPSSTNGVTLTRKGILLPPSDPSHKTLEKSPLW